MQNFVVVSVCWCKSPNGCGRKGREERKAGLVVGVRRDIYWTQILRGLQFCLFVRAVATVDSFASGRESEDRGGAQKEQGLCLPSGDRGAARKATAKFAVAACVRGGCGPNNSHVPAALSHCVHGAGSNQRVRPVARSYGPHSAGPVTKQSPAVIN